MRYSTLLLLLLTSCDIISPFDINPIKFIVDPIKNTESQFISRNNFTEYSSINQTSDEILERYYYIGRYFDHKERSQYNIYGDDGSLLYMFSTRTSVYIDYNQDGKMDRFGFMVNFRTEYESTENGKYILIDDVNDRKVIRYYDSKYRGINKMTVSDVDNDGINEIIAASGDGHGNRLGQANEPSLSEIIEVGKDGNITTKSFGLPDSYVSDMALGDIDNDGDIDIIHTRIEAKYIYDNIPNDNAHIPVFYINDGNGNFEIGDTWDRIENLREKLLIWVDPDGDGTYEKNGIGMVMNYNVSLFDFDDDGILDIHITNFHDKNDDAQDYEGNMSPGHVIWGLGDGFYDFDNKTKLPVEYFDRESLDSETSYLVESDMPFDFNGDGLNDILNFVETRTSQKLDEGVVGWTIQFLKNNGNRTFDDVTHQYFIANTNNIMYGFDCLDNILDVFMSGVPYDIDEDDDYDILPQKGNYREWNMCGDVELLWLENISNQYHLRIDR